MNTDSCEHHRCRPSHEIAIAPFTLWRWCQHGLCKHGLSWGVWQHATCLECQWLMFQHSPCSWFTQDPISYFSDAICMGCWPCTQMLPLRENDIPAQHPFTMAVASSRIHVMPSLMVCLSVWLLIIQCPHDTMILQSIVQEDPLEGVSSAREKECCPGWPSAQKKHQICLLFLIHFSITTISLSMQSSAFWFVKCVKKPFQQGKLWSICRTNTHIWCPHSRKMHFSKLFRISAWRHACLRTWWAPELQFMAFLSRTVFIALIVLTLVNMSRCCRNTINSNTRNVSWWSYCKHARPSDGKERGRGTCMYSGRSSHKSRTCQQIPIKQGWLGWVRS